MTGSHVVFQVTVRRGSLVLHDVEYKLDLSAPRLERFDLTVAEASRCELLIGLAHDLWREALPDASVPDFPEPLNTVLHSAIEIIADAITRGVRQQEQEMPEAAYAT